MKRSSISRSVRRKKKKKKAMMPPPCTYLAYLNFWVSQSVLLNFLHLMSH
jgi:hypothetical protein